MNCDDIDPIDPVDEAHSSATERQLRRLVVPKPAAYAAEQRLDVIHEPDLELLLGGWE